MPDDILSLSLEDKLYRTRYEPDAGHPHIEVDRDCCAKCATTKI